MNRLITYCLFFFLFTATLLSSCAPNNPSGENRIEKKEITLLLKDIRGKQITYDFYEVKKGNDLEYVGTEVADETDGETTVLLKVDFSVNNIIVKRTKNGVEKRQVVPIRSNTIEVQFLL